jgi:hypothetical protein
MPNIQVRDVPTDVHAALVRRAEHAGQSLQQYLQQELRRLAVAPTRSEVIDRIRKRQLADLSNVDVAALIRADRDRR